MMNTWDLQSPVTGFITIRIVHDDDGDELEKKRKEQKLGELIHEAAKRKNSSSWLSRELGKEGKEEPKIGWW